MQQQGGNGRANNNNTNSTFAFVFDFRFVLLFLCLLIISEIFVNWRYGRYGWQWLTRRPEGTPVEAWRGLQDMVAAQGGSCENVTLRRFYHGGMGVEGLAYTSSFAAATTVLEIPRSLLLSEEDCKACPRHDAVQIDGPMRIAAALHEQEMLGDASNFALYLPTLPSLDWFRTNHPLFATDEDLEVYDKLPLARLVVLARESLRRSYKRLTRYAVDGQLARMGDDEWMWGSAICLSRCMGMDLNGTRRFVLAPYADKANTDPVPKLNAVWDYNPSSERLQFNTTRRVRKGEEVLISYEKTSSKTNADYAFYYGFVLRKNPHPLKDHMDRDTCHSILSKPASVLHATPIRQLFHTVTQEHCRPFATVTEMPTRGAPP
ncbi:unnamed protein product [Vitrella brassicaformis CCMP3155]|uniref:SET domain-containing protein n=1 Tax=Vitrella brassicaformis (strain CCMP3155) TaxID=1169540 RepID=A0A0G4EC81_VITBC|nr:unnamed protein product [Vitrella brassicaformis CCMP3155]|eukprot:CEL92949.1 unnamed protein product [Vitrella brassicaformis CCMP3155]